MVASVFPDQFCQMGIVLVFSGDEISVENFSTKYTVADGRLHSMHR